jgi:hypothetical protein
MLKLPGHGHYDHVSIGNGKNYSWHKDRVWFTRAGDIAKYCFELPKGTVPGS